MVPKPFITKRDHSPFEDRFDSSAARAGGFLGQSYGDKDSFVEGASSSSSSEGGDEDIDENKVRTLKKRRPLKIDKE
jgi:hypothetical protein